MTDKQIIINDYFNIMRDENGRIFCIQEIGDQKSLIKAIREQNEYIQDKEQECFQLANVYHSLVRIANNRLDKITDLQQQLDQLKAKNEELIIRITKIFACLIKANRIDKIVDTLWVDDITTLWDYIALTLGIEGDQTQVEEQILQKISESEEK